LITRSFVAAVAVSIFASLALSVPIKAGSITTVTAINQSGKAADDFEATFTGTGGSVSNIKVLYSSGIATTTKVISSGAGTEIDFQKPLPNGPGVVVFNFETAFGNISLDTAVWTFKTGAPIDASRSVVLSSGAVPEPASMALFGIGVVGLLAYKRFSNRKAAC
jgi:PEP-CTERM motif